MMISLLDRLKSSSAPTYKSLSILTQDRRPVGQFFVAVRMGRIPAWTAFCLNDLGRDLKSFDNSAPSALDVQSRRAV
jgi:hypothetical protein